MHGTEDITKAQKEIPVRFAHRPFVLPASSSCRCTAISLLLSATLSAQAGPSTPSPEHKPLYPAATTERARTLLRQMTLEEKVGQMTQLFYFPKETATAVAAQVAGTETGPHAAAAAPPESAEDRIRAGRLGSALFVTDPNEINRLQHLAVENSRLHIPLIFGFDVIHGFRTIFPVPIALAASWDPAIVQKSEEVAAAEARSVGIAWAFAPMLDIARDPRWGRIVEGAGEDPYLGSAMARAEVRGFQGAAIGSPNHLLACAKHFAGYGAALGGRDYEESYISEAQLQNVYLPPFRAAVEAGVGSIMSAYMDLNDVPATGNRFLLTDTLRTQWGFGGFVVSDADAVKSLEKHGFAKDQADAADRALRAGVDMEMALTAPAFDHLREHPASQTVISAAIDGAVLRILEAKIQMGLFEHPYADVPRSAQVLSDPAHREVAREAAERSAVLLRNEGSLLPLSKAAYKSIAVIGPTAADPVDMTGPWTFVQDNKETVTIAQGLRRKLGSGVEVREAAGVAIERRFPSMFDAIAQIKRESPWTAEHARSEFDRAVALAKQSDLVLLTMGEHQHMSGESASDSSLDLPGDQEALIEAVVALGKPTVLLLQNGRPLNISWASAHVPAILETWHPGTEGGAAIANLLFGDAVPGGHLPFSWPRNVGQVPLTYAHNLTQDSSKQGQRYWSEPSTPLYPFGYGLSYADFTFSDLTVIQPSSATGTTLKATVVVTNRGKVPADAVAQLYLHQQYGRSSRPVRELKGFKRVRLAPGQHQTVEFMITPADFRYWSAADSRWGEDASTYDLWAGSDSVAPLHATFTRTAQAERGELLPKSLTAPSFLSTSPHEVKARLLRVSEITLGTNTQ